MRTSFVFALFFFLSTSSALAGWSPMIVCENYQMVIDRESTESGERFQLVIRNSPETLKYFSSKVSLGHIVNEKNELVIQMRSADPSNVLFTGYIGGQASVVASVISKDTYRVALWEAGYRGMYLVEIANWDFRGCFSRVGSLE